MLTLFDHLKYNNIPYKDLTDEEGKAKIEKFVDYIKKAELEQTVMQFDNPSYQFNARWFDHNGRDFITSFPESVSDRLIVLWMKLDEQEPLEAYRKIYPA